MGGVREIASVNRAHKIVHLCTPDFTPRFHTRLN